MTISELNFLHSSSGKLLLERYRHYDQAALFKLLLKNSKKEERKSKKKKKDKRGGKENNRKKEKNEEEELNLGAVVSLIELRRQASSKFKRASEMFFSPLGLEQASGERISQYIAKRFSKFTKIADLSSGIGGNLLSLAENSEKVIAVDKDEFNLTCARFNSEVLGLDQKIKFILNQAEVVLKDKKIMKGVQAIFLDPARNRSGKTKTRSLLNSRPALLDILDDIFSITKNLGVKISPAFDYQELKLLNSDYELEIISEDNVNKIALLWFGEFKTTSRRATIFTKDNIYTYPEENLGNPKFTKDPLQYLYLPNKAILKAHLLDQIALYYDLFKFSPYLPFLSSSKIIKQENSNLWRIFKVLSFDKFSWSSLHKFIKKENLKRLNIIVKELPFKPEDVYQRLRIKEGSDLFLIIVALRPQEAYYILAKRV